MAHEKQDTINDQLALCDKLKVPHPWVNGCGILTQWLALHWLALHLPYVVLKVLVEVERLSEA